MTPWLRLAKSTSSQKDVYLQEINTAYQAFSGSEVCPVIIHTIGHKQKASILGDAFELERTGKEDTTVYLYRSWLEDRHILFLDSSTVWNVQRSKILEGEQGGHVQWHLLNQERADSHRSLSLIRLHARLLGFMSHVVAIFVDDFPGQSNVIDLLAAWIIASRQNEQDFKSRPRLLLLSEKFKEEPAERTAFVDRLVRYLTRVQQMADPTRPYMKKEIEEMCWKCFDAVHLLRPNQRAARKILAQAEDTFRLRASLDWTFAFPTLRVLFHHAIAHLAASRIRPLSFVEILRSLDTTAKSFDVHMEQLLRLTTSQEYPQMVRAIASAFYADSYPTGGHRFFADKIYKTAFATLVRRLFHKSSISNLAREVEKAFYNMASEAKAADRPAFSLHLERTRDLQTFWATKHCRFSCFLCLAQPPVKALECGHWLCERCIRHIGRASEHEPWQHSIHRCPLCQEPNAPIFTLRPSTACTRLLQLDGPLRSKTLMSDFLKSLHASMALTDMPLRQHFDVVRAEGAGTFFALGMYLRQWSISECAKKSIDFSQIRMSRNYLGRPRHIRLGEDLEWPLEEIYKYCGSDLEIKHRHKAISNLSGHKRDGAVRPSAIAVWYNGGTFRHSQLEDIASRLIGALFYVELASIPQFYTSPDRCRVRLRCHIPPGPPVASLLRRLRHARIMYRGDENRYSPIAFSQATRGCSDYIPAIPLEMEVASRNTAIDVRIEDGPSTYVVSNCPYKLSNLIRDQGVENPWAATRLVAMSDEELVACHSGALCEISGPLVLDRELELLYCTMFQVSQASVRAP